MKTGWYFVMVICEEVHMTELGPERIVDRVVAIEIYDVDR